MDAESTIIAPITAAGQAAVSLLRISGTDVRRLAPLLLKRGTEIVEGPREQVLTAVYQSSGKILDYGLACYFKGPESFTGEDCLEIGLHGSPYLVSRFIEFATELGCRLASPGEFSYRAFLNGRIDLAQAEAICDLISAETAGQAKLAREGLEGKLSAVIGDIGEPLRDLLAEIEASIDFPEEEIDPGSYASWLTQLKGVENKIAPLLDSYQTGKLYREGAKVVLVGPPNAGKSSLLNRLLGEERAIVTATPGTTRDSIGELMDLEGLPVYLWDTAGLRSDAREEAEKLGIQRSLKLTESADLVIAVRDASEEGEPPFTEAGLKLANKIDLGGQPSSDELPVSALSGEGLSELKSRIKQLLLPQSGASLRLANQRHYLALKEASARLGTTKAALEAKRELELVALDLRGALSELNEIIGVTEVEDILGRIFSKFCIGK